MIAKDLPSYSLGALRAIARFQGLEGVDQAEKAALVQRLSIHLTRPENVARSLQALPPRHRIVLERLQLRGGARATEALGCELRRLGHLDQAQKYSRESGSPDRIESRRLEDVLAHLAVRGLVLTRDFEGYLPEGPGLDRPGRTAFVPSDVLRLLPPPQPIGPPAEVPTVVSADVGNTLRDALLYWSYAERNEVQVISRGTIAKRHFVKIAQALVVPEDADGLPAEEILGRTHFLRLILQQAGVLRSAGGRLRPGPRAREYFALSDSDQARTLYSAWLDGTAWNELSRPPDPDDDSYRVDPAPAALVGGRKAIVGLVAEHAPGRWVGLDEFLDQVRRDHYQFLVARKVGRGNLGNPYSSSRDNPLGLSLYSHEVPDEQTGWERIEGELIVQFILALHWLGLVALGYDGGRLVAFQTTPPGLALIRSEPSADNRVEEGEGKPLVVQASFHIVAYQHTPTGLLASLEAFAERVQAGPVFEYRLTRDSVYRARQGGLAARQILDLLEANSTVSIPQNVRQSLLDWEREHSRIVLHPSVSVLYARDPARLDALQALPDPHRRLGRRLAPDVLALRTGAKVDELLNVLARRGELLAVDDADAAPTPSLDVTADGQITFGGRLPSIYLRRKLSAFADERDGCYWVTEPGLRRAAEAGLTPDDVLATLRAYSRGPLPREVERAIAVGARRWGKVSLAAVVLVRVESREILDQMLAEPSLRGLLRRVEGQDTIAVARVEDAARVREALQALGIEPGALG